MQKLLASLNTDKLLKYGIAAILLAVPLYPKFPFITVPGTYVSIRLEDFLILIVTGIWVISIRKTYMSLWREPIMRAIVLFLVTALLSTIAGIVLTKTVVFHIGILEWGRRVEYLIGFFVVLTSLKKRDDLEFYIKCICIVLVIVFVFGFGQKYFGWPVITTQNQEYSKGIALRYVVGGHLASTFAGHYDLASYVVLTSPILVSLFFLKKKVLEEFLKVDWKIARTIIFVIIVMSFWLMVNGASRISAVSYMISISLTLFLIRKYKYIPLVFAATTAVVFLTGSLLHRYTEILDVILQKISLVKVAYAQSSLPEVAPTQMPSPAIQDISTSIRTNVEWPRAIRAFMKNPLLGTGYSSITLATDNDYLRILGELGILGVISTFFVFFRIIKAFFKKIRMPKELDIDNAVVAGIIGAIPGILLNAVFIDVFEASKFAISFWIIIGMGVVIVTTGVRNYEKNT